MYYVRALFGVWGYIRHEHRWQWLPSWGICSSSLEFPILVLIFPIALWPLVHALPHGSHFVRPHRISPCTFNPQPRLWGMPPPTPCTDLPLSSYLLPAFWTPRMLVSPSVAQGQRLSHLWPRVCKVPSRKAGARLTFPFVLSCTPCCLILKNTFFKNFTEFSSCSGQE